MRKKLHFPQVKCALRKKNELDREQAIKTINNQPRITFLKQAKKRNTYICPVCGNGSGTTGDGITRNSKDNHWKCFGTCGNYEDIMGWYALYRGLDNNRDFQQILEDLCVIYDIILTDEPTTKSNKITAQQAFKEEKPQQKAEIDYTNFFLQAAANNNFEYLESRGISIATQKRFNIGFVANWRHPKAPKAVPTSPRCIIPTSKSSYLARDTRNNLTDEQKRYSKSKVGKVHIFNLAALKNDIVFITEGEIDALSIEEVGGHCIGLGSASNTRLLLQTIKDNSKKFIIFADNDEAGQAAKNTITEAFKKKGISYIVAQYSHHDVNDFLKADKAGLEKLVTELTEQAKNLPVVSEQAADEELEIPSFFGGNDGKKFLHHVMGQYLIEKLHIKKLDHQLMIYDNGGYIRNDNHIQRMMIDLVGDITTHKRNEVMSYINIVVQESKPAAPKYILFNNTILNIETGQQIDQTPDLLIPNRIPHNYNPAAYSKIADECLNGIACGDIEVRALLEEAIGSCLYRDNRVFKKAFFLLGDGHNGKSTYLDAVSFVLGDDNVTTLDLKNLGDRFSTSKLFGKSANIGDDISNAYLADTSIFKSVSSGDRISAEFKGENGFDFRPYCKLFFSVNTPPRMDDKTGAAQNRFIFIPFNAKFEDGENANPLLRQKMQTEEVAEYLINRGIESLKKMVLINGFQFTKSAAAEAEKEEYAKYNDPVKAWFDEVGEDGLAGKTMGKTFADYKLWCDNNNYQCCNSRTFSSSLKAMGHETKLVRNKNTGIVERIFIPFED